MGFFSGQGGIRTLGTVLTYTRFPIVLFRPLRHLPFAYCRKFSAVRRKYTLIATKLQALFLFFSFFGGIASKLLTFRTKSKQKATRIQKGIGWRNEPLRPRLERGTPSLEGSCSIQLSYRSRMRGHPTTLSPAWQDKKIDTSLPVAA